MTFESYLEEKFCKQYDGLDDEMPDAMGEWFSDLDPADVIRWAEEWGPREYARGVRDGQKAVNNALSMVNRALDPTSEV